jgi:dTMP kinase
MSESDGVFIVVDGPDGAGKSTLVARIVERLRSEGGDVVPVREPGGTPAAELARRGAFDPDLSASPLAELFFILAARADLVAQVIRPAVARGQIVVSDRYELSTFAYQIEGRGLPREAVLAANRLATGGLAPDLTLLLDIPVSVGRARQSAQGKELDRMEQEDDGLHERVARAFRTMQGPTIEHLSADRTAAAVASEAMDIIERRIAKHFPGAWVEPRAE